MSDDLGKKVQQIAQMLGQDNMPDNVKELVSLIAASLNKGDSSLEGDSSLPPLPNTLPDNDSAIMDEEVSCSASALNNEVLDTAKNALRHFNSANDPRINLLNAIKPFMNNRRQKKIGNCIQLLQVAGLSRMLNEKEK